MVCQAVYLSIAIITDALNLAPRAGYRIETILASRRIVPPSSSWSTNSN